MFILALMSPLSMAQTTKQDRRIEEEKRQSLEATVEYKSKAQTVRFKPSGEFNIAYFEQLFIRKIAYRNDAFRSLVMLMGYESQYPAQDINSRISFLLENNIMPKQIAVNFDADAPLRKGEAAYMFCKAMKIRGGLWIRLFGMSSRYALKELVYQGIMLPGSANDIVSGKELILMLTESASYLTKKMTEQAR